MSKLFGARLLSSRRSRIKSGSGLQSWLDVVMYRLVKLPLVLNPAYLEVRTLAA